MISVAIRLHNMLRNQLKQGTARNFHFFKFSSFDSCCKTCAAFWSFATIDLKHKDFAPIYKNFLPKNWQYQILICYCVLDEFSCRKKCFNQFLSKYFFVMFDFSLCLYRFHFFYIIYF